MKLKFVRYICKKCGGDIKSYTNIAYSREWLQCDDCDREVLTSFKEEIVKL